jgi:hypothetical protein
MKTITKEYQVYNYEELTGEGKEKAKKTLEDMIIESRFDILPEVLSDELNYKYGITGKIIYELGYSQGDGLSFDTDELLTTQSLELLKIELVKKDIPKVTIQGVLKLIEDGKIEAKTQNNNPRYCYASRYQVKVFFNGYEEDYKELSVEDIQSLQLNAKSEKDIESFFFLVVEESIRNVYLMIAGELEKIGYKCYNVYEEDFEEECLMNEWTFLEDGSIFNE